MMTVAVPLAGAVFHSLMPSTTPVIAVLVKMIEFAPSITPPQSARDVTVAPLTVMVPVE